MPRFPLFALALTLALPAAAQPSARAVVERATAHYRDQLKGVRDYTVTQEVMGFPATLYFERAPGEDALGFTVYHVNADGTLGDEGNDMSARTGAMLEGLAARGRLADADTVDGAATYAVAVDDVEALMEGVDALERAGEDAEFHEATFYFDREDYRLRRIKMDGEVTEGGRRAPFTTTVTFSDFRTVDGFTHPFRTAMAVTGLHAAMSDEEKAQLEEAKRQMANLPPEQREMMERMMGGQMGKLDEMMGGDSITMEMEVLDLRVNTGRPD